MNRDRLEQQLILHEGIKLQPYLDTLGNWTVLIGYNLSSRGWNDLERAIGRRCRPEHPSEERPFGVGTFTRLEAFVVLRADIASIEPAVLKHFPKYGSLDDVRQRVCMDMAFNLGHRALEFKRCMAAIERDDWSTATREMYKSRWSGQVGDGPGGKFDRAERLGQMLLTGKDYIS